MGSSNNPSNEDELLMSRVYNDLNVPSYKLRIKSTNVITRKVNTGNYSNQNNRSPVPTLNYEINDRVR
jgi:hypothetical protein